MQVSTNLFHSVWYCAQKYAGSDLLLSMFTNLVYRQLVGLLGWGIGQIGQMVWALTATRMWPGDIWKSVLEATDKYSAQYFRS